MRPNVFLVGKVNLLEVWKKVKPLLTSFVAAIVIVILIMVTPLVAIVSLYFFNQFSSWLLPVWLVGPNVPLFDTANQGFDMYIGGVMTLMFIFVLWAFKQVYKEIMAKREQPLECV